MRITFPLLILTIAASCTTAKHITTTSTATDSSYTRAVDSMNRVLSETVRLFESQIENISSGGIVFDTLFLPGDTILNTVTVNGGVITAKGKIQKVYYKDIQTITERDYWHRTADSLATHRDTTAVRVVTETKYVDRTVKRKWFTGFGWWLLFLAIGFGAGYYVKSKFKI